MADPAQYRVNTVTTVRYVVMKITEDAAEPMKFKDKDGKEFTQFLDPTDAKLAMEKLIYGG